MVAFRQKVRAEEDRSMPDGAARVVIRLKSGRTTSETVTAPRGSLSDPLSDAELEAKLRDGLRQGGSHWDGERLIEAIWRLEELADMSALLHHPALSGSAAATRRAR